MRSRGFSLIEVVIALGIAGGVLSLWLMGAGALARAHGEIGDRLHAAQREAQVRAEIDRWLASQPVTDPRARLARLVETVEAGPLRIVAPRHGGRPRGAEEARAPDEPPAPDYFLIEVELAAGDWAPRAEAAAVPLVVRTRWPLLRDGRIADRPAERVAVVVLRP